MNCNCFPSCLPSPKLLSKKGVLSTTTQRHAYTYVTTDTPSADDPAYSWISSKELEKIKDMKQSLTSCEREQLASEPVHIRHDLMLCRFLRGHGNTISKAAKALRAHLQFRETHKEVLERALAGVPLDTEDFDAELSPLTARFRHIRMLQLPARHGSNHGMPLSMLVVGYFSLSDIARIDDRELMEWFLSLVEIRALCLHNQSVREHRMARVIEVREHR